MSPTRYTHTNLIAHDWRALAAFYIDVFDCTPSGPERDLSGAWVDELTGLSDVHVCGAHLLLPGFGADGPTLEVFAYDPAATGEPGRINHPGFGHIAFHVDDVDAMYATVLAHGGSELGGVIRRDYPELGLLTAAYVRDPEGNIVEIQNWDR